MIIELASWWHTELGIFFGGSETTQNLVNQSPRTEPH